MLLRQPRWIGIGGNGSIAARSASRRSTGATRIVRTTRAFALFSQSVNCVLKSAGEENDRPGMNEVSNHQLRRSTTPFDSGSRGGSNTNLVASVHMNASTPAAWGRPLDRNSDVAGKSVGVRGECDGAGVRK